MILPAPLQPGLLIRRYKRFLADIELDNGTQVTAHCPNTGAMLGCDQAGSEVLMSHSDNPRRKYPWTWELVRPAGESWVGIYSARANALVAEALASGAIKSLSGYPEMTPEVAYKGGRFDFELSGSQNPRCLVEVKSVTAVEGPGQGIFPDARSTRGARHALDLAERVRAGDRCVMLFCVQRDDVSQLRPADEIDPDYGRALRAAVAAGVEVLGYNCRIDQQADSCQIRLDHQIAVNLGE